MNNDRLTDPRREGQEAVLVGRLTVWIQDHRPGWRLPRSSDLARRYGATVAQIDAVIAELASRGIVREAADGRVYRASPAESLITLDGLPCLGSRIDPMGTAPSCAERGVLQVGIPAEINRALKLAPGSAARAIQSTWAMDGTITAVSTTYLPASLAAVLLPADDGSPGSVMALNSLPLAWTADWPKALPAALCLEVQSPPLRTARQLGLHPGEPAITVTVRFDDPGGIPVALTVAVLHAARFRIAVETPDPPFVRPLLAAEEAGAQDPSHARIPVGGDGPRKLECNGVSLDLDTHRVFADGTEITLAGKEYDLLRALLENAGRALSRRELLSVAREPGTNQAMASLNIHMRRLRRKLDPSAARPRIRAVHGVGYLFDATQGPG